MDSKKSLQKVAPKSFRRRSSRRVEGVGGAEIKRGSGAVGTQAQAGKIGVGKGSSQDVTRGGSRKGQKVNSLLPQVAPPLVLSTPSRRSPSLEKERDCWSADLEDEIESERGIEQGSGRWFL